MHSEQYKNCTIRQKFAVVAAMINGILFSLYGNCRDKIRALTCQCHTVTVSECRFAENVQNMFLELLWSQMDLKLVIKVNATSLCVKIASSISWFNTTMRQGWWITAFGNHIFRDCKNRVCNSRIASDLSGQYNLGWIRISKFMYKLLGNLH